METRVTCSDIEPIFFKFAKESQVLEFLRKLRAEALEESILKITNFPVPWEILFSQVVQ